MTRAALPPERVPDFVFGGRAVFTVASRRTGVRFTFRVRKPRPDGPHFVDVLVGANNESDYAFLGTLFGNGIYRHSPKSKVGSQAQSARAARWFFSNFREPRAMEQCEVWHEGRCCRCGRTLTVPSSIESGIGPECARRAGS